MHILAYRHKHMHTVLVSLHCYNKNTMINSEMGSKGLIWLIYPRSLSIEENKDRNSRKEPTDRKWSRIHERVLLISSFLLAFSFWLALPGLHTLLSYIPKDHLPNGSTTCSCLGSPTSLLKQENGPYLPMPMSEYNSEVFLIPLLPVTLH